MKKNIFFILPMIAFGIQGFSQTQGERHELNPNPAHLTRFVSQAKNSSSLSASYDMRSLGLVTPVKDQLSKGYCGSCWTHSCMANIESLNLIVDSTTFDLSEDNLNNCHPPFDFGQCKGGNFYMSSAYLLGGAGPLLESQDPYMGPLDSTCPASPKPLEYITDAWIIPTNDMNLIKQTIVTYGSLDVSFYFSFNAINTADSTFFFDKPYTFSTPSSSLDTSGFGQWHEVSLIGWDDNKVTAASQPGAWIIKNSIVKSSFNDATQSAGFLYVSYYDSVAWQGIGCWPKKIPYDSTRILHHYDEGGWVSSFGYNNNNPNYGVIKFLAPVNEQVQFLTTVSPYPNSTVSFDIYDSFNGSTFGNLLASVATQTCSFAGYNSFALSSPISIAAGNAFYIKVKFDCAANHNYLLPIEMAYPGYTTNASIETGKCWASANGTSWNAIGANTGSPYDLCIKAYATASGGIGVHENQTVLSNKIYPNPVNDELTILLSVKAYNNIHFNIYDLMGKIVYSAEAGGAQNKIDISSLAQGVYLLEISGAEQKEIRKIVKQ